MCPWCRRVGVGEDGHICAGCLGRELRMCPRCDNEILEPAGDELRDLYLDGSNWWRCPVCGWRGEQQQGGDEVPKFKTEESRERFLKGLAAKREAKAARLAAGPQPPNEVVVENVKRSDALTEVRAKMAQLQADLVALERVEELLTR
jgi:hypothetical protein